ncbi:MAG: rhomboid family intramembrane serine protease [Bacteroidaceae bacterium]|nr:rhomboid family intramembrane serine protease [Bacteroidaceae bacterium]
MVTVSIIIVTSILSIVAFPKNNPFPRCMARPDLLGIFMFNPYYVSHFKEYYRILASALVHTGWWHLLLNMITLYFIGNLVEGAFVGIYGSLLGRIIYLVFYLLALIVSSISDLMKYRDNVSYYFCGSSGAVSAVMFASVIIFPKISFYLFFIPIPVPGYVYALLFLLYCCYCMARQKINCFGNAVHFWGGLFGLFFPIFVYPPILVHLISLFLK